LTPTAAPATIAGEEGRALRGRGVGRALGRRPRRQGEGAWRRGRSGYVALALSLLTLLAAGASRPPAGQAGGASGCADYVVIDSRGSGAPRGLSGPGLAFYKAFRAEILRRDGRAVVRSQQNPYPAWGSIPSFVAALANLPLRYHRSVSEGKRELRAIIGSLLADEDCPDTRLILTGYSQGAQVAGDVAQERPSRRIIGVVLFGDPHFNSRDAGAARGDFERGLDGALGTRPVFAGWLRGRALSYCHKHDPVCQGPLSYYELARYRFSRHTNYDKLGEPEEAAKFLARFVQKRQARSSSPFIGLRVRMRLRATGHAGASSHCFPSARYHPFVTIAPVQTLRPSQAGHRAIRFSNQPEYLTLALTASGDALEVSLELHVYSRSENHSSHTHGNKEGHAWRILAASAPVVGSCRLANMPRREGGSTRFGAFWLANPAVPDNDMPEWMGCASVALTRLTMDRYELVMQIESGERRDMRKVIPEGRQC